VAAQGLAANLLSGGEKNSITSGLYFIFIIFITIIIVTGGIISIISIHFVVSLNCLYPNP